MTAPLFDSWGVVDLAPYQALVSVKGGDAFDFLQRMVSADLGPLNPNRADNPKLGVSTTLLTPKGRVIAWFEVFRAQGSDEFLLAVEPSFSASLRAALERFVILEEVEIEDSNLSPGFSIQGPEAERAVVEAWSLKPTELPIETFGCLSRNGFLIVRRARSQAGGFDVIPVQAQVSWPDLPEPVSSDLAEAARIAGGWPRLGYEVTDETIPPEAGLSHAVSVTKGCYVGQEVVSRIHHLGHPNKLLLRARLTSGNVPDCPAQITDEAGKEIGRLVSVAKTPTGSVVGLAYLKYKFAQPDRKVRIGGRDGEEAELQPLGEWS